MASLFIKQIRRKRKLWDRLRKKKLLIKIWFEEFIWCKINTYSKFINYEKVLKNNFNGHQKLSFLKTRTHPFVLECLYSRVMSLEILSLKNKIVFICCKIMLHISPCPAANLYMRRAVWVRWLKICNIHRASL